MQINIFMWNTIGYCPADNDQFSICLQVHFGFPNDIHMHAFEPVVLSYWSPH